MTDQDRSADGEPAPAGGGPPAGEAPPASGDGLIDDLPARLTRLERKLLEPGLGAARSLGGHIVPAWRRVTSREPRVPVTIAIIVAIGIMAALPARVANRPRWLVPALEGLLLTGILVA